VKGYGGSMGPAKNTRSLKSRSRHERVLAMLLVVRAGVTVNLEPRPRTVCAIGGIREPGVRSRNTKLDGWCEGVVWQEKTRFCIAL